MAFTGEDIGEVVSSRVALGNLAELVRDVEDPFLFSLPSGTVFTSPTGKTARHCSHIRELHCHGGRITGAQATVIGEIMSIIVNRATQILIAED
jgi:hypothetical protein